MTTEIGNWSYIYTYRKGTPHAGSSPDYSKVENIYKKAKEEAAHKNSEVRVLL